MLLIYEGILTVTLLGEYDFSDEKLQDSVGILPPKTIPKS